ncbi:glycosyltransferase family 1 protein [Candidatus Roizmanbacteria bacterium]|nr:glycosyltransferase family 1 protein [Candidatus Roizmanbacteria bacterium]
MFFSSISKVSKRIVFYRNARNSFVSNVFKRFYQYFINSLVLKYSTGILSNSEEALKHFFSDYPSVNDKRFKVIQNGVPLPLVLSVAGRNELRKNIGILPTRKIILHVGSSRWEKNHICMLKIAKLCQDNGSDICFCFAGSGIERDYNELAKKLNLRNILFLGERRDVGSLLQIADCFLFPSLSEGQPNALIEAVINSVPFVASNIATVKETLPLGWGNRWLFNPAKPEEGYLLLIEHMQNDFRNDSDFKDLVSWCKNTYNQDARFEELLATFKYDCFNNK